MNEDVNAIAALLSEFNTKISDLEARYDMLRDRLLLTSESFVKTRDAVNKEVNLVKRDLRDVKNDVEKNKELTQQILYELSQFARKEEVRILERYIKLWEPLKFAKVEEVKEMINNAMIKTKGIVQEKERGEENAGLT